MLSKCVLRFTRLRQLPQSTSNHLLRDYSSGKWKFTHFVVMSCNGATEAFILRFSIADGKHRPERNKFNIRDEVLDGRPLYLDAQATTPLVSYS